MTSTFANKQTIDKTLFIDLEIRQFSTISSNEETETMFIFHNEDTHESCYRKVDFAEKRRMAFYSKVNDMLGEI